MPFRLPETCPVCEETLAPDRSLEDHLLVGHTHREVVDHVVSREKGTERQSVTD